jgi:hypothetical protein
VIQKLRKFELDISWIRKVFGVGAPRRCGQQIKDGTVILSSGDNASLRYLLIPHLAAKGVTPACVNPAIIAAQNLIGSDCSVLIICRYLPVKWISVLRAFRKSGGRVIYFMDDDLMDPAALIGLPSDYVRRIRGQATKQSEVLNSLCDEFWVGSPYLAEKYKKWAPTVLSPRASVDEIRGRVNTSICYHGTASHQSELEWLVPVVESVVTGAPDVSFEVFGDHKVNRLYRDMPRVAVLHPMGWTNYLSYTGGVHRDIALAPLLSHPFNAARGPTKFFDFTRMGAVGVYTDVPPYRGFVRDGVDGVLIPNDPAVWVRTIRDLIGDADRRTRMSIAARDRATEAAWDRSSERILA